MPHNTRHRPLPPPFFKRKTKSKRLPWKIDMTLCMAAISIGTREPPRDLSFALVTVTDQRVETESAGGNFGDKQMPIAQDGQWHALYSDIVSAAHNFTSTLRTVLRPHEFTRDNLLDNLSQASSIHKQKLIERLVRSRVGMSFEHFRLHGEQETPADVRTRLWYDIEQLDYKCELIVCGFLDSKPQLFEIDRFGDVEKRITLPQLDRVPTLLNQCSTSASSSLLTN